MHHGTFGVYLCVIMGLTHKTVEKKNGSYGMKAFENFFSLQVLLNSLMYSTFQASSRPAMGFNASSTDTRSWSSTISFYALLASYLYILDCLLCILQSPAHGKGKVSEVTRHSSKLYVGDQIESLKHSSKVGLNISSNNAEGSGGSGRI